MMNNRYDYFKRKTLILLFLLFGTFAFGQVGIQTNSPNASSALDIVATDKGLLIPRVTLTAVLTNPSPVTAPATGLMVFNSGANQPVGFYYWDGSTWAAVGGNASSGDAWELLGNAGTSDANNFVGTTDNIPLNFRVNNTKSGRLTSDGTTFLGYQAGNSSASIQNTAIGYQSHFDLGSGKYNTAIGYQSAYEVTSGNYNVAVGYGALHTTRSGANNVAIGHDAGPSGDSWANTISIGWGATATSTNQVRIGNNDIDELFCMGAYAATSSNAPNMYVDANGQIMRSTASGGGLAWLLEGNSGTVEGTHFVGTIDDIPLTFRVKDLMSGKITSGGFTTFGHRAGELAANSSKGTFIGFQAGILVTDGKENTFVGNIAANKTSTGDGNVSVGFKSLLNNTTGGMNTSIGAESGMTGANYSNSTALGYKAMCTGSDQVRLGDSHVEELFCQGAYFSTSSNSPNMYVDANGQIMRSTVAGGPAWLLAGNSGTTVGTDFIGTTDAEDFAIYTNNAERMRFMDNGQGLVGIDTPYAGTDFFTIEATATIDDALRVVAPGNGVRIDAGGFGLISFVDNASGYPFYAKNYAASSYGGFSVGSNRTAYTLASHYAGLSAHGDDGIFTLGQSSSGIGVIAGGNGITTVSTIASGTGGAFSGYHGIYAKAVNSSEGVGIIGVGNNGSSYTTTTAGSGGALTGYHGLISSGINTTYGTGVIGVGNGGSYYTFNDGAGHYGSGGAFTGQGCGVAGWADRNDNNSVGVYGYYNGSGSNRDGKGVQGIAVANSGRGYGVWGQGNRYGVYANGNMGASGTKSFEIDHPMEPEEKTLKHYSMESPEVLNLYRGSVNLDENGEAEVVLPDYFLAININFTYSLTAIGQQAPNIYISKEIDDSGSFEISGGNPGQKLSWVVYAERNDLFVQKYKEEHEDIVEIEKEAEYKGKYLMPELYNQPPEMGIFNTNLNQTSTESVKHQTIETSIIKTAEPDKKINPEL